MNTTVTRIIIGLSVIAGGVLLLLSNLDVGVIRDVVREWWPIAIVVGGLLWLVSEPRNYMWALLVVAIGAIVQLDRLDVVDVNVGQLILPAIIIAVGLSLLFKGSSTSRTHIAKNQREDVTAILGGNETHVHSDNFKASSVTAVLGGAVIDLRNATIKEEAVVEVFCFWGGVEIRIPKGVQVRNETTAILGSVENTAGKEKAAGKQPVLHVTGDVIMGGVEIKH